MLRRRRPGRRHRCIKYTISQFCIVYFWIIMLYGSPLVVCLCCYTMYYENLIYGLIKKWVGYQYIGVFPDSFLIRNLGVLVLLNIFILFGKIGEPCSNFAQKTLKIKPWNFGKTKCMDYLGGSIPRKLFA
jgi:hypothetical protein